MVGPLLYEGFAGDLWHGDRSSPIGRLNRERVRSQRFAEKREFEVSHTTRCYGNTAWYDTGLIDGGSGSSLASIENVLRRVASRKRKPQ